MVAPTDGVSVLSTGPQHLPGTATSQETRAELLATHLFGCASPIAFLAGWLKARRAKVITVPVPVATPAHALIRTSLQRLQLHKLRAGFYFMTLSALLGCIVYESAATALARTASVVQFFAAVDSSALVASIFSTVVANPFGAAPIQDISADPTTGACTPTSLADLTACSLASELQLWLALLSFANPANLAEQQYINEWGGALLHAFDPAAFPSAACDRLPPLQQQALVEVPYSHPTLIPVTSWKERKPRQTCRPCPGITHCSQLIVKSDRCSGLIDLWWEDATQLAKGEPLWSPWRSGRTALFLVFKAASGTVASPVRLHR